MLSPEDTLAIPQRYAGLIKSIAAWWWKRNRSVEFDDLLQAVRLGFLQAAARYDPSKGPFDAYAVFYARRFAREEVQQIIGQGMARCRHELVRVPRPVALREMAAPRPVKVEVDFWDGVQQVLSDREYQAVRMRFVDDAEFAEIGAALGIDGGSAWVSVKRSLVKLLVPLALEHTPVGD